ncbi:hypothetical protein AMS68_006003 [Peltaster fructicola]|uniref:RING-type domain-containing protein n=1 Tax=Peltaster fructicola TaxID=286661 RepID=A0A6H0Y0M9_9PEZI|nr:hypothetical protein AMS68_006003 [Peltaster fructicola]
MGQSVSQPPRGPPQPAQSLHTREERARWRPSSLGPLVRNFDSHSHGEDAGGLLNNDAPNPPQHTRSGSTNRLSRLLSPSSSDAYANIIDSPRRSALQRSRTTITNMFRRDSSLQTTGQGQSQGILQRRTSYVRTTGRDSSDGQEYYQPRLPSIDQSSIFDRDMFSPSDASDGPPSSSQSNSRGTRFSLRRSDRRLSSWNADGRPFGRLQSALRRRRTSPTPASRRAGGSEDQAVLLSQLLSAAAAATAATLMGDDHQALNEARSLSVGTGVGDLGGSGEDGSFDGFLRALQSGRIASALRQSGEAVEGPDAPSPNGPLNFFRMFRFGSSTTPAAVQPVDEDAAESNATDGRMIPIIIVGIRSISPNSNSGASTDDLPPFLDALTSFAAPTQENDDLGTLGQSSIDSILRPPHNGTSFRHRRRASMGGFGMSRNRINDRYDDQRDHRSPDRRRERPWSIASSMSEPRPPPATPASPSPELSRISSRNSTPSHSRPASFIANSIRELAGESRRNSILHRSASSPLAIHTEESISVHSTHSSDNLLQDPGSEGRWAPHRRAEPAPNVHYPRFASGHPRRNGVVEPDNLPSLSRPSTSAADGGVSSNDARANDSRSWIIYVLGGSYPENHPILTTPSLFSDNPTYEDMMLLSALLGPAKAPVATEEDVQNAGGLYNVAITHESSVDVDKLSGLVATATDDTNTEVNPSTIALEAEHRCLVCLCDFEAEELLRRLGKCGHLFHKDCIDHWLTQGRNSCPLCRGEGVEEKAKGESAVEPLAAAA